MSSTIAKETLNNIIHDLNSVGEMILSYYNNDYTIDIKSDESPVTCADIAADAMIRDIFKKYTPQIPVISEEVKSPEYEVRKDFDYFWLVDPLDGTKEFINKTDEFAINIALVKGTKPVIGIIHLPVQKETYFATEQSEVLVYKDDIITPLEKSPNSNNVLLVSRSHKDDEAKDIVKAIEKKLSLTFKTLTLGSSHKQIAIIKDMADMYVKMSGGPQEWDFAAGQVLIEQSGGSIINVNTGKPPVYNKRNFSMSEFIMKSENYCSKFEK